MAFAMAWRMAHVVSTVVGRPIQVAIVKGLNKNLGVTPSAGTSPSFPRQPGALQRSDYQSAPSLILARRSVQSRGPSLSRVGNGDKSLCAQDVDGNVEEVGKDGPGRETREEGEER